MYFDFDCSLESKLKSQPLYESIRQIPSWKLDYLVITSWANHVSPTPLYAGLFCLLNKIDCIPLVLSLKGVHVWIVNHLLSPKPSLQTGYWVDDDQQGRTSVLVREVQSGIIFAFGMLESYSLFAILEPPC